MNTIRTLVGNNRGSVLIIVMSFAVLILLGFKNFLSVNHSNVKYSRISLASERMKELSRRLESILHDPRALMNTRDQVPSFKNCVENTGTNCDVDVSGGLPVFTDMNLYDGVGTQVAGTAVAPVHYDIYGDKCFPSANRPDCIITVTAAYRGMCNTTHTVFSCSDAIGVEILFTLSSVAGTDFPILKNISRRASYPSPLFALGSTDMSTNTLNGTPITYPVFALGSIPLGYNSSQYFSSSTINVVDRVNRELHLTPHIGTNQFIVSGSLAIQSDGLGNKGQLITNGRLILLGPAGGTPRMVLPNVEVGNYDPITDSITSSGNFVAGAIDVHGDITGYFAVFANSFLYASDRNLKKNIQPLSQDAHLDEMIDRLQGRQFRWKDSNQEDIGFIAQEVEQVFPFLVHANSQGKKAVKYESIIPLLVEANHRSTKKNRTWLSQNKTRLQTLEQMAGELVKK